MPTSSFPTTIKITSVVFLHLGRKKSRERLLLPVKLKTVVFNVERQRGVVWVCDAGETPRQYGIPTPKRTSTSLKPSRDAPPASSAAATTTRQVSAGCWTPLGGSHWRNAESWPAWRCSTRSRTASSTVPASRRSWPAYHHRPRQRRGHSQHFNLVTCRTQYRSAAFLPRTVRDWNALPAAAVEACTVVTFVSRASR